MPWKATRVVNLEGTVYQTGQVVPEAEKLRGFPLYRTLKKIAYTAQEEQVIAAPSAASTVNPSETIKPEVKPIAPVKEPSAAKTAKPTAPKLPPLPKSSK